MYPFPKNCSARTLMYNSILVPFMILLCPDTFFCLRVFCELPRNRSQSRQDARVGPNLDSRARLIQVCGARQPFNAALPCQLRQGQPSTALTGDSVPPLPLAGRD
jgi:hypothetical protein